MPELPEVETVRRTLAPAIGDRVTGAWASGLPLHQGRIPDLAGIRGALTGAALEEVRRWGKYLLLYFCRRSAVLVVHLGMSGRLRLMAARSPRPPHTHFLLRLRGPDGRRRVLRYSDPRRFGLISLAERGRESEHPSLRLLGRDPLTAPLSGRDLARCFRGQTRPIKVALVDQRAIAGLGNIYASEALWQAKIPPALPAGQLAGRRAAALARAVGEVIDRALTHGGTTLRDFVSADGASGDYAGYLWVYGRAGEPCARRSCRAAIARSVQQGRATFYCPRCQAG